MASDLPFPPDLKPLPVGTVVERRDGDRAYLVVQETPERGTVIESWEDALGFLNRVLGRINAQLMDMNADMAAFNERLAAERRNTAAQIEANQRELDELVSRVQ
jgi:hypothetical protein